MSRELRIAETLWSQDKEIPVDLAVSLEEQGFIIEELEDKHRRFPQTEIEKDFI